MARVFFIIKISEINTNDSANGFRLPSEDEWLDSFSRRSEIGLTDLKPNVSELVGMAVTGFSPLLKRTQANSGEDAEASVQTKLVSLPARIV